MNLRVEPLDNVVRAAAFRLLLESGKPVGVDELARSIGQEQDRLRQVVQALQQAGQLRGDGTGKVTGSGGLSVTPDRHEIEINSRRFWTWCAYDILGIFGALGADGSARSVSPAGGRTYELRFEKGRPRPTDAVLFRPDASLAACCENVYEEWCPNSNLFADESAALAWAEDRGLAGQVLTLAEASDMAAAEWRSFTERLSV